MLKGLRAVVTGASTGIRRAVAVCFAREGARVLLAARSEKALAQTVADCLAAGAPEAIAVPCDLTAPEGVDALSARVLELGPCDVLVNNAGMGANGNGTEGDPDEWDRMLYLNLHAPMRLTRRLAPSMIKQKQGVILNIGSIAGVEPMSGPSAAYAAAKHGLRGWSTSIYQSLRYQNVKVCLVSPAFVDTPLVAAPGFIRERMIKPEDLAEVCLLPFRMSSASVPTEVTLRLTLAPFKSAL